MTYPLLKRAAIACCVAASMPVGGAEAQAWRQAAASIAPTARALIIGTRPEDEDNALIAWLSLGRNVETAYLSLTRGESAPNVAGTERQAALAVVRTAELLEERKRDGARQYFTRAYDFGPTPSDSTVDVQWPHDVLLGDVVTIVRAFRPQVIISLISDSLDKDATRRVTGRLAREAYALAGDSAAPLSRTGSRLPLWSVARLYTRVESSENGALAIDVGEFDRVSGRTFAEIGGDIRRLQRTQPPLVAEPIGHAWRYLRLDSTRVERAADDRDQLFGNTDTTLGRFRDVVPPQAQAAIDSLRFDLAQVRALAPAALPDSLAVALARVVQRTSTARLAVRCTESSGVPMCPRALGDLAVTLRTIAERAVRATFSAAGIVIDGRVDRELVASGDSVPVTVSVFNGGARPVDLRRLAATDRGTVSYLVRDTSIVIRSDSVARWPSTLRVRGSSLHWWQTNGLVSGTSLHDFQMMPGSPAMPQLMSGEDRIPSSAVEATIAFGGIDVPIVETPLVYRSSGMVRGDNRHPLAGITPISLLLDRPAEYERAGLKIDRLIRVFLSSAKTTAETLTVRLDLPQGLKADSSSRVVIVPPLSTRSVFFRLRGMMRPSSDSILASAQSGLVAAPQAHNTPARAFTIQQYSYGSIGHDYPHIPSQQFVRSSKERLESVDIRVPPSLRVAYVKGTDEVPTPLGQLQVPLQPLEASLLSVVDLSWYTTILIGAGAMSNDALATAIPSLQEFMRKGGNVVVLAGGDEVARSGLAPYPMTFDAIPGRLADPQVRIAASDAKSQLLTWPNRMTAKDFDDWSIERARGIPSSFDSRYRTPLTIGDAEHQVRSALLAAPVGKGMFIYSPLSVDRELAAVHPGAARLFVNLLSAGLRPGVTPR